MIARDPMLLRPSLRPRRPARARGLTCVALSGLFALGCQELLSGADGGIDAPIGGGGTGGNAGNGAPGCGLAREPEPNDDREQATAYTAGTSVTGCVASASDVDFYEVASPAGAAGGYFAGAITDVGDGVVGVRVLSAVDNAPLLQTIYTASAGASLFFYWAAAPGQTFRVAVAHANPFTGPFRYTLRAVYSAVADAHEPNDTRALAKPLRLGSAETAFLFAGHRTSSVASADFDDWYTVDLGAGALIVRVDDVPANVRLEVSLFDPDGAAVPSGSAFNGTSGGAINLATTVARAGRHFLAVTAFPPAPDTAGKGDTVPPSYTQPYRLTVTQR